MSEQEAVMLLLSLGYTLTKNNTPPAYYPPSTPFVPNWPSVQPICCPICGLLGGHHGLACPRLDPKSTGGQPL